MNKNKNKNMENTFSTVLLSKEMEVRMKSVRTLKYDV